MIEMRQNGGTFYALDPSELKNVAVVAQALDNQWVPRAMLHEMVSVGRSLEDVKREREKSVRTEYLRALINARQLVINRAFIHNNPVVFQDYLRPSGEDYKAFKELLDSAVIVPYLFNEQTPLDKPDYEADPRGFPAWEHICQEVRTRCLRLSWDDKTNMELIRDQLARRFHDCAQTLCSGDEAVFAQKLGLASGASLPLKKRLVNVAQHCLDISGQGQHVTRNELYKQFVTADGTTPAEGKYDRNKPFAADVKQLLDLSYNINLPDALDGYPLTPVDSLQRTALQEWQKAAKSDPITADQIETLLRRSAFSLVQEGLDLPSVGSLSLKQVQEVRLMDEWSDYIRSLEDLLAHPGQFENSERGAQAVYNDYVALAGRIRKLVTAKITRERTEQWTPIIETVFDIAGAVLKVIWSTQGVSYQVEGEISSRLGGRAAPVVARLIVRGFTELGAQADLRSSIHFMRGHMEDARQQWKALEQQLSEIPHFKKVEVVTPKLQEATINAKALNA